MRFRQLLILIVLVAAALLTSAQTSPNFGATRTALAQQTQIRQGTRIFPTFPTPAEFQLTVSAQALDTVNTARAMATPSRIPSVEAQIFPSQVIPTELPDESEPIFGNSALLMALLLFTGVIFGLGILGWFFFAMNKREQGYRNRR